MVINAGVRTDVGLIRSGNEDAFIAAAPLFAVADGMGGHLAGEVAADTAVNVLRTGASSQTPEELEALMQEANRTIWSRSRSDPQMRGMGTTCSMVLVKDAVAHVAHVGDSRIYTFRAGELAQVTEDHTLVARLVKEGRLRPEDADNHPHRNVITRALGIDEHVDVDLFDLEIAEGDRILLCSDGLSSMVASAEIADVLAASTDPQTAADALIEAANRAGGEDNITVIVLDFAADGTAVAPAPEAAAEEISSSSRWPRRLAIGALATVGVLAAAGFAARYAIDNVLWYVGVDDAGRVAVFHGVPDSVAGVELSRLERASDLHVEELPEFVRDDVATGHKVDSLEEALEYIDNLEARALEFSPSPSPAPSATGKRR